MQKLDFFPQLCGFHSLFCTFSLKKSPFPKLIPASCPLQAISPCSILRSPLLLLTHSLLAQAPFTLPQPNPQLPNTSQVFLGHCLNTKMGFLPQLLWLFKGILLLLSTIQIWTMLFLALFSPSATLLLASMASQVHSLFHFFLTRVQGLKNTHRDTSITDPHRKASATARLPAVL